MEDKPHLYGTSCCWMVGGLGALQGGGVSRGILKCLLKVAEHVISFFKTPWLHTVVEEFPVKPHHIPALVSFHICFIIYTPCLLLFVWVMLWCRVSWLEPAYGTALREPDSWNASLCFHGKGCIVERQLTVVTDRSRVCNKEGQHPECFILSVASPWCRAQVCLKISELTLCQNQDSFFSSGELILFLPRLPPSSSSVSGRGASADMVITLCL